MVAAVGEIGPGERKLFVVKGRPIAVFNVEGAYFGLFDRCPHQGGSLSAGIVTGLLQSSEPGEYRMSRAGEFVRCPWHGWEFDIQTGQSYCDPERVRTRSYAVSAQAGSAVVAGPYVAERVPISVEGEYIVVEM